MKHIFPSILIIIGLILFGCSSSEKTTEQTETPPPPPAAEKVTIKPEPPATKKIDTVSVEVQNSEKPSYEPEPIPPDVSSKYEQTTIPTGKFSVQIGAYKMPDNADRIASLAKERFNMNVYTNYDETDQLYKVMIGDFETKDSARSFRDAMATKYPDDYKDAWVSENPQK